MNFFSLRIAAMLLVLAAFCGGTLRAQSQDSIFFTVEHTTILTSDTVAEVRVFATGTPLVVGFQLSLVWEATELTFENAVFSPLLANFDNAFNHIEPNQFRAVSFSSSLDSISLQEDSLLLTLRFHVGPEFSGNTPIFTETGIPTEVTGSNPSAVIPFAVRQGFVSYGNPSIFTNFTDPFQNPDDPSQFCVELLANEAYAISGFELELEWDDETFPLADVITGDNPLLLTESEIAFNTNRLSFTRAPESGSRFPAILESTGLALLCFTTDDPDAVSDLSFGEGRSATAVFGFSPTGEIVSVQNATLEPGTISQPVTSGLFSLPARLPALDVFPNPANNVLNLSGIVTTTAFEYSLWDKLGRRVRHGQQRTAVVDVSSLLPGVYSLGVTQGDKHWLNRIVISR